MAFELKRYRRLPLELVIFNYLADCVSQQCYGTGMAKGVRRY